MKASAMTDGGTSFEREILRYRVWLLPGMVTFPKKSSLSETSISNFLMTKMTDIGTVAGRFQTTKLRVG